MNEQLVKTIQALECAAKEMHSLHDTFAKLEGGDLADWHEVLKVAGHQAELDCMVVNVSRMLFKREAAMLEARTQKTE